MPGQGQLPKGNARQPDRARIASSVLPAEGRTDKAPRLPNGYKLGKAGAAWWRWAWKLPQATMWDAGAIYFVARRAQLEDDSAIRGEIGKTDLGDLLAGADPDAIKQVEHLLGAISRIATGTTSLMKEMRELDNRLGLNPKAMGELRWSVAERQPQVAGDGAVTDINSYRDRLG